MKVRHFHLPEARRLFVEWPRGSAMQLSRREYLTLCGGAAAAMAGFGASARRVLTQAAGDDQRMAWWREARFGIFMHWGLYSVLAGSWQGQRSPKANGEWIMNDLKIPLTDYEQLVHRFNPVRYDPQAWAAAVAGAGAKYLVITSKHHEGFALWDSAVSDYDIAATPYRHDLLGPLASACGGAGVRFCTYHSILDWHHPDYLPRRAWDTRPASSANFDRYVTYLKAQLREIVSRYDPGVLWFDGEWEDTWTHERGVDLYNYVRGLKPDIIINNRVDKGRQGMQGLNREGQFKGDFGTPEQQIPATGLPGVDWESCMTMNDTWGYRSDDDHWKSAETLIRNLVDIASKGGNFLLNVGPTAEGLIPQPSLDRLAAMGRWMDVNGDAIHGTTASPIGRPAWGRVTSKPGTLFLHVFDWPTDGTLRVPVANRVTRARLLANAGQTLTTDSSNAGVTVHVPTTAPDAVASVIALDIDGEPRAIPS
ncbi:MAG TPA: alpha-L-fucosidase [Vicinamibacterales bacterium]|nr:alpha-L-fucosidase [Vicinamibacterales bacterium]